MLAAYVARPLLPHLLMGQSRRTYLATGSTELIDLECHVLVACCTDHVTQLFAGLKLIVIPPIGQKLLLVLSKNKPADYTCMTPADGQSVAC